MTVAAAEAATIELPYAHRGKIVGVAGCVVVLEIPGVLFSFAEIIFDLCKTISIDIGLTLLRIESSINVGIEGGSNIVDLFFIDLFSFIDPRLPVFKMFNEPADLFLGFFIALRRFRQLQCLASAIDKHLVIGFGDGVKLFGHALISQDTFAAVVIDQRRQGIIELDDDGLLVSMLRIAPDATLLE